MALQIWLPLNGTLENKGCTDITVVNNGATVNTAGKIGSCYSFDGNDDYISIVCPKLNTIFSGGAQPFSVAMWINHADSSRAILMGAYGLPNTPNNSFFNLELSTAHAYRFDWKANPDWYPNNTNVGSATWAHVVCTYDGTQVKIYLNGSLTATRNGTLATLEYTGPYYLGRDSRTGTTAFNGKMNDFRVYDHCLSTAEIKELSQGLILHYKLDDIVDDIRIIDSSGYSHHGSIKNTVEIETDTIRYLKSINLPNGNSAINCGRGGMVTDSITYSMWINYSTWGNPVSCTEGGGWNFETNPVQLAINIESIGYLHAVSSFQPTANEWHMLTGVYDRLNQKAYIYIDGQMTGETNASSPNLIHYNGSNVIWLGVEASGSATAFASNGMIGKMSDFRIYCTALSAEDILDLYHTSAKIDKTGKVHTFEFVEDESTKITKTGITEWVELIEEIGNAKFNSQYISANEFIEK